MGDIGFSPLDQSEVLDKALNDLDRIIDYLGLDVAERTPRELFIGRQNGSLHITISGPEAGLWHDFGGSYDIFGQDRNGGNLVHLFAAFSGPFNTYGHALRALDTFLGGSSSEASIPIARKPRMQPRLVKSDISKMDIMRETVAASRPVSGTAGEAYMKSRGIDLQDRSVQAALAPALQDLRFHAEGRLYYSAPSGNTCHKGPALLLIGRDEEGEPTNIQQVFLTLDGSAKLSLTDKDGKGVAVKRSLCPFRHPFRLPAPDGPPHELILTEGPENALSLRLAKETQVWACFGNQNLAKVDIPDNITHITIASDGDAPDAPAEKTFRELAYEYRCLGYHVRLVSCRDGDTKMDANDFLQARGRQALADRIDATPFEPPYPVMSLEEGQAALSDAVDRILQDLRPRVESLVTARQDAGVMQVTNPAALKSTLSDAAGAMQDYLVTHADGIESDHLKDARQTAQEVCNMIRRTKVGEAFRPDRLSGMIAKCLASLDQAMTGAVQTESPDGEEIAAIIRNAVTPFKATLKETLPSTSARQAQSKRAHKARMEELGLPVAPPAKLVLGTPGLGKTRSLQHVIRELGTEAIIWVLQPTLLKAEEFEQETRDVIDLPITVVRGRGAFHPDAGTMMCQRGEFAERLGASGRQIGQSICRRVMGEEEILCPYYADCLYIAQQEALKAHQGGGVFVMSHTALSMPNAAPRPDLVIVDEDPSFSLQIATDIDASRFAADASWRDHVMEIQEEKPNTPITKEDVKALFETVDVVEDALGDPAPLHALASSTTPRALQNGARVLRLVEEQQISPVRPDMPDKKIKGLIEELDELEIKKIGRILRSARDELKAVGRWTRAGHDEYRASFNGITINRNAMVKVNDRTERLSRVGAHFLVENKIAKTTPVIVLDGTADPELLARALGRDVETHRIDVERMGEVIHVHGKSFSTRSLVLNKKPPEKGRRKQEVERLQQELIDFVDTEGDKAPTGVFVCSALRVKEEIFTEDRCDAWTEKGIAWSHFGATRGINKWQACETAILVGRKQPPADAVWNMTRAFYALDPEPLDDPDDPDVAPRYERQKRPLFDKQSNMQSIEIDVAPDPRVHRVLWQMREAEAIQALDRVRGVRNFRRIILLGDIDLRRPDDPADTPGLGLPVDTFFRWSEVSAGETRIEAILRMCHDFLPLAPMPLHGLARAEFRTVAAAKKWLQRAGLTGSASSLDYKTLWNVSSLKRLRVRPEGTRGKGYHLLFDTATYPSLKEARNRFEEIMGMKMAVCEEAPATASAATVPVSAPTPVAQTRPADQPAGTENIIGQEAFQRRRQGVIAGRSEPAAPEPPTRKVAAGGQTGRPAPRLRPALEADPTEAVHAAAVAAAGEELAAWRRRQQQIIAQVMSEYERLDETDPDMWA